LYNQIVDNFNKYSFECKYLNYSNKKKIDLKGAKYFFKHQTLAIYFTSQIILFILASIYLTQVPLIISFIFSIAYLLLVSCYIVIIVKLNCSLVETINFLYDSNLGEFYRLKFINFNDDALSDLREKLRLIVDSQNGLEFLVYGESYLKYSKYKPIVLCIIHLILNILLLLMCILLINFI
jgi:hypothetical protein